MQHADSAAWRKVEQGCLRRSSNFRKVTHYYTNLTLFKFDIHYTFTPSNIASCTDYLFLYFFVVAIRLTTNLPQLMNLLSVVVGISCVSVENKLCKICCNNLLSNGWFIINETNITSANDWRNYVKRNVVFLSAVRY